MSKQSEKTNYIGPLLVLILAMIVVFICFMPKKVNLNDIQATLESMSIEVEMEPAESKIKEADDGTLYVEVEPLKRTIPVELSIPDNKTIINTVKFYISEEVNRLNHYIGIVSIMVALFGIFGSVVAIGMGISLSLKERGITEELDKATKEATDAYNQAVNAKQEATKAYEQAVNAKQEAKLEKDNLQRKFNQYILGTYTLSAVSFIHKDQTHAQHIEMFRRMVQSSIYSIDEVNSLKEYAKNELLIYSIARDNKPTAWISNLISMSSFLMSTEATRKQYITNNKKTFMQILEMILYGLDKSNADTCIVFFHAFISRYVFYYTAISKVNLLQDIDDINKKIIPILETIKLREGGMGLISQAAYEEFYRITELPQPTQQGVKNE